MQGGHTIVPLCTPQGMGYKWALACCVNIRKVSLKLVGNTREVGVNRLGVDVGGLESDEEKKSLLGGFNIKAVRFYQL